tara:strand:+ start:306 stop:1184 length:879 start_codon:yes stop_codon:yes gene_type:complete
MKLCKCGCGNFTKWNKQFKRYNEYLHTHNHRNKIVTEETKLKMRSANLGKKYSEETKRKISKASKGRKHSEETKKKISIFRIGKNHSDKTKKKISEKISGKNHPLYGKNRTEEIRQKISKANKGKIISIETREKIKKSLLGFKHLESSKKLMSINTSGKNNPMFGLKKELSPNYGKKRPYQSIKFSGKCNPNWQGGISKLPYGFGFNKILKNRIKNRDNNICQICYIKYKILCIHHIDYDKQNNDSNNLITLCNSCHVKTNYNRDSWILYFNNLLGLKENYENKSDCSCIRK